MLTLPLELPINKVRNIEFQEIDDKRARKAFKKIYVCSQMALDEDRVTISEAECSMLIAMLQSPEYLKHIVSTTDLGE